MNNLDLTKPVQLRNGRKAAVLQAAADRLTIAYHNVEDGVWTISERPLDGQIYSVPNTLDLINVPDAQEEQAETDAETVERYVYFNTYLINGHPEMGSPRVSAEHARIEYLETMAQYCFSEVTWTSCVKVKVRVPLVAGRWDE